MWHGPAKVILSESHQIIWISHLSQLYRCAPEHLRALSERERERIPEMDGSITTDLPQQIGSGVFQYHDMTRQASFPVQPNKVRTEIMEVAPVVPNLTESPTDHVPDSTSQNAQDAQPDSEPGETQDNGENEPPSNTAALRQSPKRSLSLTKNGPAPKRVSTCTWKITGRSKIISSSDNMLHHV